jgi:hypothetical protein
MNLSFKSKPSKTKYCLENKSDDIKINLETVTHFANIEMYIKHYWMEMEGVHSMNVKEMACI